MSPEVKNKWLSLPTAKLMYVCICQSHHLPQRLRAPERRDIFMAGIWSRTAALRSRYPLKYNSMTRAQESGLLSVTELESHAAALCFFSTCPVSLGPAGVRIRSGYLACLDIRPCSSSLQGSRHPTRPQKYNLLSHASVRPIRTASGGSRIKLTLHLPRQPLCGWQLHR